MTDSNYTHVLAIVDRSGSMGAGNVYLEMQNALNDWFKEQAKVEGKCLVDYAQFDTVFTKVYEAKPVEHATAVIEPRGMTALLDAIGRGVTELGEKLAAMPESQRPGKVLVAVVTDGMENSSREYTAAQVKELVQKQQDEFNWEFVFLGANMDAVAVGGLYGFKPESSLTFNIYDGESVVATSSALSNYTTAYRGGSKAAFSDEDRKKANRS